MTKKELEEIMDKLIYEAGFYCAGFDACAEILLQIIKDYEEALEKLYSYDNIDAYNNDDTGYIAEFHENPKSLIREVLKKHKQTKEK